jgi:hypothetical protein
MTTSPASASGGSAAGATAVAALLDLIFALMAMGLGGALTALRPRAPSDVVCRLLERPG